MTLTLVTKVEALRFFSREFIEYRHQKKKKKNKTKQNKNKKKPCKYMKFYNFRLRVFICRNQH